MSTNEDEPLTQLLLDIRDGLDRLEGRLPKHAPADYRGQFHDMARQVDGLSQTFAHLAERIKPVTQLDLERGYQRIANLNLEQLEKAMHHLGESANLFVLQRRAIAIAAAVGLLAAVWFWGVITASGTLSALRHLGVTTLGEMNAAKCKRFGGSVSTTQAGRSYCYVYLEASEGS